MALWLSSVQQSSLEVEHIGNDHRISCHPESLEKIEEDAFPSSCADWFYSLHSDLPARWSNLLPGLLSMNREEVVSLHFGTIY